MVSAFLLLLLLQLNIFFPLANDQKLGILFISFLQHWFYWIPEKKKEHSPTSIMFESNISEILLPLQAQLITIVNKDTEEIDFYNFCIPRKSYLNSL